MVLGERDPFRTFGYVVAQRGWVGAIRRKVARESLDESYAMVSNAALAMHWRVIGLCGSLGCCASSKADPVMGGDGLAASAYTVLLPACVWVGVVNQQLM
jgi:hypothetical protein